MTNEIAARFVRVLGRADPEYPRALRRRMPMETSVGQPQPDAVRAGKYLSAGLFRDTEVTGSISAQAEALSSKPIVAPP